MVRTPKNYEGTASTNKRLSDLLEGALSHISAAHRERPDLILQAWAPLVGDKLAPMTEATSFGEGVLTVKVKNSTLLSILSQNEKGRLVAALQKQFPSVLIRNIIFRIG